MADRTPPLYALQNTEHLVRFIWERKGMRRTTREARQTTPCVVCTLRSQHVVSQCRRTDRRSKFWTLVDVAPTSRRGAEARHNVGLFTLEHSETTLTRGDKEPSYPCRSRRLGHQVASWNAGVSVGARDLPSCGEEEMKRYHGTGNSLHDHGGPPDLGGRSRGGPDA